HSPTRYGVPSGAGRARGPAALPAAASAATGADAADACSSATSRDGSARRISVTRAPPATAGRDPQTAADMGRARRAIGAGRAVPKGSCSVPGTGRTADLEPDHTAAAPEVRTPLVGEQFDQVEAAPALAVLIHVEPGAGLAPRRSGVADLDAEHAVGGFGQRDRHGAAGEAARVRVTDRVADQLAGEQYGVLDPGSVSGAERAADEQIGKAS